MMPSTSSRRSQTGRLATRPSGRNGSMKSRAVDLTVSPQRSARERDRRARSRFAVPAEFRQLAAATPFALAGAFLQFIGRVLGKPRFDVAIAGQPLADGGRRIHLFVRDARFPERRDRRRGARLGTGAPLRRAGRNAAESQAVAARPRRARAGVASQPDFRAWRHGCRSFSRSATAERRRRQTRSWSCCVDATGPAKLLYAEAVYAPEAIEQLLAHFGAVLESMGSQPAVTYRELDLVNASDRRKLVYDWNATELDARSQRAPSRGIRAPSGCRRRMPSRSRSRIEPSRSAL